MTKLFPKKSHVVSKTFNNKLDIAQIPYRLVLKNYLGLKLFKKTLIWILREINKIDKNVLKPLFLNWY